MPPSRFAELRGLDRCGCMWCGLDRLFQLFESIGIHNQQDLDDRMKAIALEKFGRQG